MQLEDDTSELMINYMRKARLPTGVGQDFKFFKSKFIEAMIENDDSVPDSCSKRFLHDEKCSQHGLLWELIARDYQTPDDIDEAVRLLTQDCECQKSIVNRRLTQQKKSYLKFLSHS